MIELVPYMKGNTASSSDELNVRCEGKSELKDDA